MTNHTTTHDGCYVRLTLDDDLGGERPFLHLDLGLLDSPPDDLLGPRISCRRGDDKRSWVVLIHPDDGDPVRRFVISDVSMKLTEEEV